MSENVKIVPASCTQCGGTVEVDPQTDIATCPFCGTPFIVEKAINNYNIQHAKIEHADNVNIDMTGSVKSVLDFVGEQMKESRAERREARKIEAENSKMVTRGFLKIFGIVCIMGMILAIANFIIFQIRGDDDSSYSKSEEYSSATYSSDENDLEDDDFEEADFSGEFNLSY